MSHRTPARPSRASHPVDTAPARSATAVRVSDAAPAADRPAPDPLAPGVPAQRLREVDEAAVRLLVTVFYGRVRDDDMIGPVFRNALEGRWDLHLDKMVAFWSSIVLGSKSYRGNVTQAHKSFAHLSGEHFTRWLGLFFDTLEGLFEPQAAMVFAEPAVRIAESLQLSLFGWEYTLPPSQRALVDAVKRTRPARPHSHE